MYVPARTILSCYGRLNRVAEDLENAARNAAVNSFYGSEPCEVLAERICSLIEKRNLIVYLKNVSRRALKKLSKEDFDVLALRYGRGGEQLYCSRRSYFRKLSRAHAAFASALNSLGLTDEEFKKCYAEKITFIGVMMDKVLREDAAVSERIKSLKPNGKLRGTFKENVCAE